eukprot:Blabericola_migrator_1__473@NODE_1114_length_5386_cov_54_807295_g761_i0_p4_GENE_NODE_1114_length_5386_cov_54_807295_g761_i0NODE_1114_length_5386_cov_54_807295_g761_i0_p4_ORF_typecomplete_len154_score31_01PARG_cat/PF05028_14/2_5e25_NODE_1114_length_5386_cov_54_807295_g761_i038034264
MRSFQWAGSHRTPLPSTASSFLLMNATTFHRPEDWAQYKSDSIIQEVNKCACGFTHTSHKTIATGNWGCGCYNGDVSLKFVIQWLVASFHSKSLLYAGFEAPVFSLLRQLLDVSKDCTVGQLMTAVLSACQSKAQSPNVAFSALLKTAINNTG